MKIYIKYRFMYVYSALAYVLIYIYINSQHLKSVPVVYTATMPNRQYLQIMGEHA